MGFPLDPILQLLMLPIWGQGSDSSNSIQHKNKETAALGENVTIFCNLTTPVDVVQITWQKVQDSLPQNIGTYSNLYGEKILPPYIDRLHCKFIEPYSSFMTLRGVTFDDEACYKCLFNVFPQGSQEGQTCLNIITVSELKAEHQYNLGSEDFLQFVYSAVGKPAPQISLFPSQVLITPPEERLARNPNGTVTVTKIYNVSLETARSLSLQHLIVFMDHPLRSEEKTVPLSVKQECSSSSFNIWRPIVEFIILCIPFVISFFIQRKKKSENGLETLSQQTQPEHVDLQGPLSSST